MVDGSLNDWTGPLDGWECAENYVWPINDLRPHIWNDDNCWCKPFFRDGATIHNSLDGREFYEEDSIHIKRKPT